VKALLNGDSLFDPVFDKAKPVAEKPFEESPDEELIRMTARQAISSVPHLSTEQAERMIGNPPMYWAFNYLLQTGVKTSLEQLQRDLDCSKEKLLPALDQLVAMKLIEKKKDGYISPHFRTDLFDPPNALGKKNMAWISEQIVKRVAAQDKGLYHGFFFLAVEDETKLGSIMSMGREFSRKAYLYRSRTPVSHGMLVGVECRITNLAPIGAAPNEDESEGSDAQS
jgi:DNA-binding HxlR family transcriptional regulator